MTGKDNPFLAAPRSQGPSAADNPFLTAPAADHNPFLHAPKRRPFPVKGLAVTIGLVAVVGIGATQFGGNSNKIRHAADTRNSSYDLASTASTLTSEARSDLLGAISRCDRLVSSDRERFAGLSSTCRSLKSDPRISCTRRYAESELQGILSLTSGTKVGADSVYSTKQGTPTATTYFNGGVATTFYHDGQYTSRDGVQLNYRVKNNSRYLRYKKIEAVATYRSTGGVVGGLAKGAFLGALAGAAMSKEDASPMAAGAALGALAGAAGSLNTKPVIVYANIPPGGELRDSVFFSSMTGEFSSDFRISSIQAEIDESALWSSLAPGCR